ncbi:hypothetical protein F0562_009154 [Nyssa sinensis]|uniref:Uncharacterized protein n=1 Tax=Nyssa sinensis TaxID=561372 RepID=A0A5J4ZXP5_9ASTE|nr:hypothetical protein F0562_009154 [Nyssa sinensis]
MEDSPPPPAGGSVEYWVVNEIESSEGGSRQSVAIERNEIEFEFGVGGASERRRLAQEEARGLGVGVSKSVEEREVKD